MDQLELFHGDHVPVTAARRALARGDVRAAVGPLAARPAGSAEAADALRLRAVAEGLERAGALPDLARIHEIFASVLAGGIEPGVLRAPEWFAFYARSLASGSDRASGARVRGWLGAHFAWAAGDAQQALALAQARVARGAPGPDGLEAARIAFAAGRVALGQSWLRHACLASPTELACDPPRLEPCGIPVLDEAPALPRLPDPIEQLWNETALLSLEGLRTPWIAVVGEIDGVLGRPLATDEPEPPRSDAAKSPELLTAAQAFSAALRSARRARERDGHRRPDHCSDRELRARRRMQELSPVLLSRYLSVLRASLFV